MTIDQLACKDNCPKEDDHSDDTPTPAPTPSTPAPTPAPPATAPCRGKLTPAKDPKKIEFAFSALKTPQYSDILASSFFVNSDSTKCPITKCTMMGTDCQSPYTDGIAIDAKAPWKISAVSNYHVGFSDPVCIVCENAAEKIPFKMTID